MILFLDEERGYLSWVTHHRQGFVLDSPRKATGKHVTVHRATCELIKRSESKRTHWTTGSRMKGCSLDLNELQMWAQTQTGSMAALCSICTPDGKRSESDAEPHLTRL